MSEESKRPIIDRTTGVSLGLIILLAALGVGWVSSDATFKENTGSRLTSILDDVTEIKEAQKEDRKIINDLRVRVALLEDHEDDND